MGREREEGKELENAVVEVFDPLGYWFRKSVKGIQGMGRTLEKGRVGGGMRTSTKCEMVVEC